MPSAESVEVRWIAQSEIATLTMDRSMRMRVAHYLAAAGITLADNRIGLL